MRRLLRWAFNISAAVSAVLFLVMLFLSVRSGFSSTVEYAFQRADGSRIVFAVPPYTLLPVLGVLPAAWSFAFAYRRRGRRDAWHRSRGLCPACGYNMRATPSRCPECGAVPAEPRPRPG
jgi:hypothetical protein